MRKPPQGAKTAVWMAGGTGWLIKHAWSNVCHKIQKAKESCQTSNHLCRVLLNPKVTSEQRLVRKCPILVAYLSTARRRLTDLVLWLFRSLFCFRRSFVHMTG